MSTTKNRVLDIRWEITQIQDMDEDLDLSTLRHNPAPVVEWCLEQREHSERRGHAACADIWRDQVYLYETVLPRLNVPNPEDVMPLVALSRGILGMPTILEFPAHLSPLDVAIGEWLPVAGASPTALVEQLQERPYSYGEDSWLWIWMPDNGDRVAAAWGTRCAREVTTAEELTAMGYWEEGETPHDETSWIVELPPLLARFDVYWHWYFYPWLRPHRCQKHGDKTLVGYRYQCVPCEHELERAEQRRQLRASRKAEIVARGSIPACGAPTRMGEACRNEAGRGTDHPFDGRCSRHELIASSNR